MTPVMAELNERSRRILHAIVTEFIESGEPVGSRTLSKKYGLDISPATIRNVMADLEENGFLYQPHTSAGRLPTEKAFRLFVDSLMTVSSLSGDEQAEIHSLDELSPGMALLRESSRVLSRLAGTASVIVAPALDRRRLREIHFVAPTCSDQVLLAVLLFFDGTVESRMVDVQQVPLDIELERMHNLLAEEVAGKTLRQLREKLASTLSQERIVLDHLTKWAYELGLLATDTELDPVVMIEGKSRLIAQPDFGDVQLLRDLLQTLDDRERLLMLLDRTIVGRTVQVWVGKEAELGGGSLSLITAPFREGDSALGTIGVIGPTRMNYPKVIPLVQATAAAMSEAHDRAVSDEPLPIRPKPKQPA
ncbi:MAG: Heat-inducible transcription repressor HrcA [Deltaproteobacteria bacterium ADurb.Bin207]|nr:MAG: Heat-inducible transcription repressor HrcA [Deltaproteobacteria bacterium ADurb.Bin207]